MYLGVICNIWFQANKFGTTVSLNVHTLLVGPRTVPSLTMVSLRGLSALLGVAASLVSVLGQDTTTDWPVHNNGLNKVVEWYVDVTKTREL